MSSTPWFAPPWLSNALQGLSYWVGHRRTIYSAWELSEGALVAELCNLCHAHLPERYRLRCEEPYSKFLPAGVTIEGVGVKARVDLSVWERYEVTRPGQLRRSFRQRPTFAIEVKRAKSPKAQIDNDLKRLAGIAESTDGVRAILVVTSEGTRPRRFTTSKGTRLPGNHPIEGTNSVFQVIAVKKATDVYSDRDKGHYAIAIEVFEPDDDEPDEVGQD